MILITPYRPTFISKSGYLILHRLTNDHTDKMQKSRGSSFQGKNKFTFQLT